ncbi:hypothetical protein FB45DRAFT_1056099 [Roridomyces roridus]|uniref:F-box domain-containing protein n=1 Tax=Roridomyces roridus TaxID=1738132 RepID=A0AAD7FQ06_9AGAR|nr:hypothetical protein FB45DRAFT_1056099 [Roridomyces roridus]
MSLSRLNTAPIELQFMATKHLGPYDLLSLSHVSTYWRAFVLSDKRWAEWFSKITNNTDDSLETVLTNSNVLDAFSKRTLVYTCIKDKCEVCGAEASQLFILHMERVCDECLETDEFAVLSLGTAAAKYDLRESELYHLIILDWVDPRRTSKRATRLVSDALAKQVAITKFGSEEALTSHLSTKRKSALSTYASKADDYRRAVSTREELQAKGDSQAAENVVLAGTGRKIPKAFPSYPGILGMQSVGKRVNRREACFKLRKLLVVGSEVVVEKGEDE